MIAICTKEPELLRHHGSLRQTGHTWLSLSFPQDTSYGHAFLGEERLAAESGLEIYHWVHSTGLGWFWWKSCSKRGNSRNMTEISPHPPACLCALLFTLPLPCTCSLLQVIVLEFAQVVMSPWGEMEIRSQPKFHGFVLTQTCGGKLEAECSWPSKSRVSTSYHLLCRKIPGPCFLYLLSWRDWAMLSTGSIHGYEHCSHTCYSHTRDSEW